MSETEYTGSLRATVTLFAWCGFLWILAILFRLYYFPYVQITSDTLSPFVGAIRWWNTGWFGSANPESDQWLWLLSAPLLVPASNLSSLFWWKCVATTILIPGSCWMVVQVTEKHHWFWMLVISSILTLDMGLVDTMLSSFRGYWAPECMTVAMMGIFLWKQGNEWGIALTTVATIIAMGQHPLVIGTVPALVWLWVEQYRKGEYWWVALVFAAICLLPRLIWLAHLMQCDAGGVACLTDIAMSSSESEIPKVNLLVRALHDRLWIEMGLGSVLMIIGWWYSGNRELKSWLLWSVVGIVVLGLSISTLRPYHFRVLIVPMFVLSIQGLSKLDGKGIVLGVLWIGAVIFYRIEPVSWYDVVDESDEIASVLCEQKALIWLEGYGPELGVSPQSVGVSMFLQGCQQSFGNHPPAELWVVSRIQDHFSLGEVKWFGETHQLQLVSSVEWSNVQNDLKWSGHDVASLFWNETSIYLE